MLLEQSSLETEQPKCFQSLFVDFAQTKENVNCTKYQSYFVNDCSNFTGDGNYTSKNECMGCYVENYCNYIGKMFAI